MCELWKLWTVYCEQSTSSYHVGVKLTGAVRTRSMGGHLCRAHCPIVFHSAYWLLTTPLTTLNASKRSTLSRDSLASASMDRQLRSSSLGTTVTAVSYLMKNVWDADGNIAFNFQTPIQKCSAHPVQTKTECYLCQSNPSGSLWKCDSKRQILIY